MQRARKGKTGRGLSSFMSLQAVAATSYAENVLLFTRTVTHSHVLGFCSFEVYNLDLVFDPFSGMLVCLLLLCILLCVCVFLYSQNPLKEGCQTRFTMRATYSLL